LRARLLSAVHHRDRYHPHAIRRGRHGLSEAHDAAIPEAKTIGRGRARISPDRQLGADLLFQIISERYERGAILMSTNRAFKNWPEIFNNDTTLTSALLDRLLHHADTCVVEGKSYRAKDHIPEA
jgi:hypothetical protein